MLYTVVHVCVRLFLEQTLNLRQFNTADSASELRTKRVLIGKEYSTSCFIPAGQKGTGWSS